MQVAYSLVGGPPTLAIEASGSPEDVLDLCKQACAEFGVQIRPPLFWGIKSPPPFTVTSNVELSCTSNFTPTFHDNEEKVDLGSNFHDYHNKENWTSPSPNSHLISTLVVPPTSNSNSPTKQRQSSKRMSMGVYGALNKLI